MGTQPPPDSPVSPVSADALDAEHRTLKQQMAELREEHDRLHAKGGTKAEHEQHLRNLRRKIKELEDHCERLKAFREAGS